MKADDLQEHPEGGRFQEVFRSNVTVSRIGPGGETGSADSRTRAALTHIYFSLESGEVSAFHKVASDEVWNLYRGQGLKLHVWDGTHTPPETHILSRDSGHFCEVVPAGCWQAAEPLSGTVLAGCTVAPGFEFEDFELMETGSEEARLLATLSNGWDRFLS
ncbi:MAG: cupin domain-containing protein [Balneolaceae bacterium]|nr:cupin domain-containing protein [Balneolaceae bacterium]